MSILKQQVNSFSNFASFFIVMTHSPIPNNSRGGSPTDNLNINKGPNNLSINKGPNKINR